MTFCVCACEKSIRVTDVCFRLAGMSCEIFCGLQVVVGFIYGITLVSVVSLDRPGAVMTNQVNPTN